MGPCFLLQPAAETGKLYPLPLLLKPQSQRKAGLVRVWIWGDWGLGNGDKRMCLSCIGLDILHDSRLLPVQKWGPHYTSVPSCRGNSQGPGGVTMEEKLLHLLHHRSTDCGCCRMAQQMLLNFLPLHPGSLVTGTEPRMLLLAAHQRIESVPCRR